MEECILSVLLGRAPNRRSGGDGGHHDIGGSEPDHSDVGFCHAISLKELILATILTRAGLILSITNYSILQNTCQVKSWILALRTRHENKKSLKEISDLSEHFFCVVIAANKPRLVLRTQ